MSTDPMSSNNTSKSPPAWLNTSFIQKALHVGGGYDSNVKVEKIDVTIATAPGDNYASVIYRVHATLADDAGEHSLLVKTEPEGDDIRRHIAESGFFKTETAMLANHIPTLQGLLEAAFPGRFPPFAPRCLLHGTSPSSFIVLEDLKPQGFLLAERLRGLGLRHSLLAVRTLARFHAASVAMLEKDPSIINEFPNLFLTKNESRDYFLTSSIQMTADLCKKIPDLEEYAAKLERFLPIMVELFTKFHDPKSPGFKVLLHGDNWSNNFMFKYDDNGYLNDFRMVDWQISRLASPSIDLLYFLFTSTSDEVSKQHEDLLIREYHVELTKVLRGLGKRGPSLEELISDINLHSAYSVFSALGVWPLVRAEKPPDMDKSMAAVTDSRVFLYENESMKRWLQWLLPEFEKRGWLKY